MVAIIRSSTSVKRCCRYNENKVEAGLASCILAGNYPCEASELTARQRMLALQKRLELNERCKKACLHIVLSFLPQDRLTLGQLKEISQLYMDQIGLGDHPFLVYQHRDTLHPHLHLVTVMIKADGSRDTVFLSRQAAAKNLIKQIEKDYQLTPSQGRMMPASTLESAQKLRYGKIPLTAAISQVLSVVLPNFKYSSLTELNAVLRHYNLVAKTGQPGSKIRLHQGLAYQMLDDQGRKIGIPVKASRLLGKPTLRYLHERFEANRVAALPQQQRLKTLVDLALIAPGTRSLAGLGQHLSQEGVKAVYALDPSGKLCEIIFVDFRTRSVFSASQLGGRYTPAQLVDHFAAPGNRFEKGERIYQQPLVTAPPGSAALQSEPAGGKGKQLGDPPADESLLKLLLDPVPQADHLPRELKRRLAKKRKQISLQL